MSDEQNSDSEIVLEGPEPVFEDDAFSDDEVVVDDEPLRPDNAVNDPNPTEIQDNGLLGGK